MDASDALSPDQAHKLLDRIEPMTPEEIAKLLRYLIRANDDLGGKVRMLKNEVSRNSRK